MAGLVLGRGLRQEGGAVPGRRGDGRVPRGAAGRPGADRDLHRGPPQRIHRGRQIRGRRRLPAGQPELQLTSLTAKYLYLLCDKDANEISRITIFGEYCKKISQFFVNAFAPVIRAPLTTRRCTTPPRTTPRPSPTARTGPTTAPARCSGEPDTAAEQKPSPLRRMDPLVCLSCTPTLPYLPRHQH